MLRTAPPEGLDHRVGHMQLLRIISQVPKHFVLAALKQFCLAQKQKGVTDTVTEADGCHVTWIISLW